MLQSHIKALVFDLDGTLYVSSALGSDINETAVSYIAGIRGLSMADAHALIKRTREKLISENCLDSTLSKACTTLGGDLKELHARFSSEIKPEQYLSKDERVVDLLRMLSGGFDLYLYTNNNRNLSGRIMALIGIEGLFRRVFTIEDSWVPKPDRETLDSLLNQIERRPEECLFVGDRYDIDLRLPAEVGCAVFLVKSVEDLFPLCNLFHEENL